VIGFSCERVIRKTGFNVILFTSRLINENNFVVQTNRCVCVCVKMIL